MTTTPSEPSPEPTVVPSGDPRPGSIPDPEPGDDPGVAPAPEVDPDSARAAACGCSRFPARQATPQLTAHARASIRPSAERVPAA